MAEPVLQAAELQTRERQRLAARKAALQRQADTLGPVSPEGISQALQRQQAPAPQIPTKPQTVGDWVTVMRMQAEQAEGRRMTSQEAMQYTTLQRQVAHTIAQNFRQDRQPAIQRYEQYGQHLATLQRSAAAPVANVALQLMPAGERPAVQRAIDESIQREAEQQAQDEQALKLHSLQRQLAELDHEATQPVMARIQARRGSGNPLPEAVQRHLEQGLNHDLSTVRIHDDAEADKLAKKVNAVAFTTGQDIYFQSGKFNPNTQSGLELLAHEVTHTVQQAKGEVGPGVDPSASHEEQARETGRKLATKKPAQNKIPVTKPQLSPTAAPRGRAVQRKVAANPAPPQAAQAASQSRLGVIKHSDGAVCNTAPSANAPQVVPQALKAGQKVTVLSQTPDGWSQVVTVGGQKGYVQSLRVTTDLPDIGAQLVKVPAGTTAIGLAEKYYKGLVKPGQDLRYYVNVLKYLNEQRGTKAFQGEQVKAGAMLWIPGPAYAASLVGVVGSGSITGGALAKAKAATGNSPGANILRSVLESPQYVGEVLGETWETVKDHLPAIVGTTVALIGTELLVGALAAAPEPTTITKFLAVGLQGIITAAAGVGAAAAGAAALQAGQQWLSTAWASKGNATQIHAASKAFLRMIGDIVAAAASAAGVKAGVGKTQGLTGLYTKERLIQLIGSKPKYDELVSLTLGKGAKNIQTLGELLKIGAKPDELVILLKKTDSSVGLLNLLRSHPINDMRLILREISQVKTSTLEKLIGKVPDIMELRDFLRKTGNPGELLHELQKYPLAKVRTALSEIDSSSVKPEFAMQILHLKLKYPIPTKPATAEQTALLNQPLPLPRLPANPTKEQIDAYKLLLKPRELLQDSLYQGRQPIPLSKASQGQIHADAQAGKEYQAILDNILKDTQYVYRAMRREDLKWIEGA